MQEIKSVTNNKDKIAGNGNGPLPETSKLTESGMLSELILLAQIIRKFWKTAIVIFIATATFTFWYLQFYATYTSTVRFSVFDWRKWYPSSEGQPVGTPSANDVLRLFYSDEVINSIVKKYTPDSITNSYINSNNEVIQREKVRNCISIENEKFDTYVLKVKWNNREQSAEVANSIVQLVNNMNLQLIEEDMNARIKVMEQLFKSTNSDSTDKIVKEFNAIETQLNKMAHPLSNEEMEEIKSLRLQFENLTKSFSDRMVMMQLNEWVLNELSTQPFSGVRSIQKAYPDRRNYTISYLLYGIIAGIFSCLLFPLFISLIYFLKGKNPEQMFYTA